MRKRLEKQIYILFILFLLIIIPSINAKPIYYNITLEYNSGNITIKDINIIFSQQELSPSFGDYSIKLYENERIITSHRFVLQNTIYIEPEDNITNFEKFTTQEKLDYSLFNIFIPYNKSVNNLIIYNEKEEKVAELRTDSFYRKPLSKEEVSDITKYEEKEKNVFPIIILFSIILLLIIIGMIIKNKFKKTKKSQTTIFIIISIILLSIIAIYLLLTNNLSLDSQNTNINNIKASIENCIGITGEKAIVDIAKSGGYYNIPEPSIDSRIPYYFYENNAYYPNKKTIEKSLSEYMDNMLLFCLNNFEDFNEFEIISEEPKTTATIKNNSVTFDISLPISIKKDDTVKKLDKFKVEIKSNFGKIHSLIQEIINIQKENPKDICINCIEKITINNNLYISMNDYQYDSLIFFISEKEPIDDLSEELTYIFAFKFK